MRKAIFLTLVLCVCSTVVMAQPSQMTFLPTEGEMQWNYRGSRTTPGATTAIYSETTQSGFFIGYNRNNITGLADDLPGAVGAFTTPDGPDNADPYMVTGFDFTYFLRASLSQLPVTATVRFIEVGFAGNMVTAEYGKVVINSITTTGLVTQVVTLSEGEEIIMPKNVWMEIQFSDVVDVPGTTLTENIGWSIAADVHSEGAPAMGNSDDIYSITQGVPVGSSGNGLSFFGGYTPNLPTADANYTPPGNFLFNVTGKKIPEPATMGLLAMGLTGIAALRRRR